VTGPPGGGKNRQKLTVVRAGLPCVCFRRRADSWTSLDKRLRELPLAHDVAEEIAERA
jgi:hypothetical protein